jgi:DNA-binding MarR family transcriptional regulator
MTNTPRDASAGATDLPSRAAGAVPLAHAIISVERTVTKRLAALRGEDCGVDRWHALALLSDGRGYAMSDLIAHTLLPPTTVTRLVDGMVSSALAYRHVDDQDRRRVLVYATERGHELYVRLADRIEEHGDELFRGDRSGDMLPGLAALVAVLDR